MLKRHDYSAAAALRAYARRKRAEALRSERDANSALAAAADKRAQQTGRRV